MDLSLEELSAEEISPFSIRGYYKNLLTYFSLEAEDQHKKLIADLNRIRISPEIKSDETFLLHADIDGEIIAANYVGSKTFDLYWSPTDYNGLYDADTESRLSGDAVSRVKLHRFYAKFVTGKFTMTLGRQQVRFGSGRLWNPLDILNPISPTFVEGAEDQNGTDALRAEYYPAASTEIAVVYAPKRVDDRFDFSTFANSNTNIATRVKTTIRDADVALLAGRVARRNLAGCDIAAIVRDGMLRGSLLYASPDEGDAYFMGSLGYEYSFRNGVYCLVEYFYNQDVLNRNHDLFESYSESVSEEMNETKYQHLANRFLTFNRHYIGLALGYDLTPLLRGDLFTIADVEGRGIFFSPSLKYNLLQNLDISVTAMLGHVFEGADKASDFTEFEDHPLFSAVFQWYF